MSNKQDKPPLKCLLDVNPTELEGCHLANCEICGFNVKVAKQRHKYIEEHGLTLCADGLRRLIIKKENHNMAKQYKECPHCGAHLDSGEKCDCRAADDDNAETDMKERTKDKVSTLTALSA